MPQGTIHKGRPQNFRDFQPPLPPLSAFHATYQYYLSAKSGNSQTPPPPLSADVLYVWSPGICTRDPADHQEDFIGVKGVPITVQIGPS